MSHALYELLRELESARIHFTLARYRPDTVLVTMALAGERVEVDVFEDGRMDVERFQGSAVIGDAAMVAELIAQEQAAASEKV